MYIWKAALCVLYEDPDGDSMNYTYIAHEILRRGLAVSRSRELSQTVGTILREHGHGHFYAEGNGYYRLRDRAASAEVYERMTKSYPHLFAASSEMPPVVELSVDNDKLTSPAADSMASRKRGTPAKTKIAARQTSQWDVADLIEPIIAEHVPASFEGLKKRIYINAFERDGNARKSCIQAHGFACAVCSMKFEDEFGDIGKGFIHVHHLLPLSNSGARKTNPIDDLRPVCPNCHAMLHRGESIIGRAYSIDEIRDLRRRAKRRKLNRGRRKNRKRAG